MEPRHLGELYYHLGEKKNLKIKKWDADSVGKEGVAPFPLQEQTAPFRLMLSSGCALVTTGTNVEAGSSVHKRQINLAF